MTRRAFIAAAALLSACGTSDPEPAQYGPNPQLPEPQRGLLPSMEISEPTGWGDQRPVVPQGFEIAPIATGLAVPRQTIVLPNGDILVAEGRGGGAPILTPKDALAGLVQVRGISPVRGGNRLTLLRDANGDGTYEGRAIFADNLNAPYGLALVGNTLYVANQDALVRFDYRPGQARASGP
ncbi:MAG TPA: sorbosone dehydrogenase family protein, partial [Allosphingosinicella sp.]